MPDSSARNQVEVVTNGGPANDLDLKLVIAIPIYNDWEVASWCLRQLDSECAKAGLRPSIVIVNDGSAATAPDDFLAWGPRSFSALEVLDLYRNLGHQRAICVAMVHVCQTYPGAAVLVMDADGEDPPEQILSLIKVYLQSGEQRVIFAARGRRMEGFLFKLFYQIYRWVHIVLVGRDIRIGNFSIVPPEIAARLARSSDLWNHYAACVVKSQLPYSTFPIDRGRRQKGRSSMNFTALVLHGLSAMSVYSDVIGVRILIFTLLLLGFSLLAPISVVIIRSYTTWAIPGWATNAFALALILITQVATVCLLFTFGILQSRSGPTFIPIRDCHHLVMSIWRFDI